MLWGLSVVAFFLEKVMRIEWPWRTLVCRDLYALTDVVWLFYVMRRQPVCHRSLLCVSAVTTAVVNTVRSAACQGTPQRCKRNTSSRLRFINLWHFSCPSYITTLLEEKSPNQTRLVSNKQLPTPQLPDIIMQSWKHWGWHGVAML